MREILFRGKDKNIGEWVTGNLYQNQDQCFIMANNRNNEVIPETVGQYTGLTDKNGVKIFEGDILKFKDEIWESCYTSCGTEYNSWDCENFGVVGFDEETGRFDFIKYKFYENSVEADLHENHTLEFVEFVEEHEIVGNIHDNPELLELRRKNGR